MSRRKRVASIDDLKDKYEKELKIDHNKEIKIELSFFEKIFNIGVVRKALIIISLALIWQFYAAYLDNELMFPTFLATLNGFWNVIASGELAEKTITSLKVLVSAYACGILIAGTLTVLAITTRVGTDLLEVLTSMFNPLPAIALLPLALLWFGLGYPSIIFVIIHAVTWPIALNIYNGFMGVSNTLRMVGKNYELTGLGFV
ncbi:MAG: hypothetical protein LBS26_02070, partial [Campylobacteraceae bacterium]|nr:hypothetical protein [Campylobacteraceae bacterium]